MRLSYLTLSYCLAARPAAALLLFPLRGGPPDLFQQYLNLTLHDADISITAGDEKPGLEQLNITIRDFGDPVFRATHGLKNPHMQEEEKGPKKRSWWDWDPNGWFRGTGKEWDGTNKPHTPRELECMPDGGTLAGAYLCYDYLMLLNGRSCESARDVVNGYCAASYRGVTTVVAGQPVQPFWHTIRTGCSQVARGMEPIFRSCTRGCMDLSCRVGGDNSAHGNGMHTIAVFEGMAFKDADGIYIVG